MKYLRTLLFILGLAAIVLLVLVFDSLNPGTVQLDLAFFEFDVRKAKAFAMTLALGWLLGVVTTAGSVLRLMNERRRLRKSMRNAQIEVTNLRNMPIHDVK